MLSMDKIYAKQEFISEILSGLVGNKQVVNQVEKDTYGIKIVFVKRVSTCTP